ncbi:MAG: peptidylprolyl isomerase [Alphaproteobacteria bacterium]|nr:peptidylprolyl isomerase [Alphaproteobacteria bacterium]
MRVPAPVETSPAPLTAPFPAAGAATGSRGQAVEGVAVLVNDEVISYSDVRNRAQLILLSLGGGQPDEATLLEAQQRAIESLIEEKLQVQTFLELVEDGEIGDDEIDQEIAGIAQQNGVPAERFIADLQTRGVGAQTLREQVKADIAWNNIVRGRFARQVRVSELRVNEMLGRLTGSLGKPQYRLAEIFLYAPDVASRENAKARAETLQRQIEQGAPFEAVAQQFSAAPSASAGGDLGWLTPADMRAEVLAAVEGSSAPAFLPPIETEGGVYLYALLGKREPANPNEATLSLKQIVARGDDAAVLLAQAKGRTRTCADVAATVEAIDGLSAVDLNEVALSGMAENFRAALQPLEAGGSTDVIDISNGKAVLYVCDRASASSEMPTREQVRSRLFDTEITMLADRYLRDLKREATIIRR